MTSFSPGTIIAGKYRLDAILGCGGMGVVYRAHHLRMDTAVALKVLHPELADQPGARERFSREARAVARIRHPNVVLVYDVDTHDDALYMVMELLNGESYAQLIRRPDVSRVEKLRLLLGAMAGVAAAHEQGVIHRDVKPENILVSRDARQAEGLAKVVDFGISKLRDDAISSHLTESGATIGTPMYMSMEQMRGLRDVDQRADVYSFGVVLYETLTGKRPFAGPTAAAIALEMHEAKGKDLRAERVDVSAELNHVVMKAMAVRREHRYDSVAALAAALTPLVELEQRRALDGMVPAQAATSHGAERTHDLSPAQVRALPAPPTLEPSLASRLKQRRVLWGASAVSAAGLLALVWLASSRVDPNVAARARTGPPAPPAIPAPVAIGAGSHQAPSSGASTRVAAPSVAADAPHAPPAAAVSTASEARRQDGALQRASRPRQRRARAVQGAPLVQAREELAAPGIDTASPRTAESARGVRSGELRREEL